MAQHDYVIANGTGAAVRSDLNNALAAIVSQNSGATAPATTYAFQFWADTTTGLLKLRNSANSAWVTLFQLDGEWSTLPVENGTAAAPSIYFKDSGTDTGFYSPGTDQVAISTGGTGRLFINSSGSVGIGTSSPSVALDVIGSIQSNNRVQYSDGTITNLVSANGTAGVIGTTSNHPLAFFANNGTRMTLTAGGSLGIGTTSPGTYNARLALYGSTADETRIALFQNGVVGTSICANGGLVFGVDGSTGGTERARIDNSGRLLVGTSSTFDAGCQFQVVGNITQAAQFFRIGGSDNTTVYIGSARGTTGTPLVLASTDIIGTLAFRSYDGSAYANGATIKAEIDGITPSNDLPTRLVFSTTADGASSPTERLRIANNGAWGLGGANYGSSSQVLTSNGSGSAPTWQTVTAAAPAALSTASGSAPSYSARAWVNFDGTGTVAIRANGNVSSITDNGVGDYTVNFTTAMPDANYAALASPSGQYTVNYGGQTGMFSTSSYTESAPATGSARVTFSNYSSGTFDPKYVNFAVFR